MKLHQANFSLHLMFARCRLCRLTKNSLLRGRSKTIRAKSKITVLFSCINSHCGGKYGKHEAWKRKGGVSVAETGSIFGGRLWGRRATLTLIREHRRQHHVNSLHSSMSSVPRGQRIKATASLTEAAQSALGSEEGACTQSQRTPSCVWCGVWVR